jgi:biofilm PGA synthesis N-glycosyltransferase PgaC
MIVAIVCLYGIGALGWVFTGLIRQQKKESKEMSESAKIQLEEITVLIPFRNESRKLPDLLKSFACSSSLPAHILLVDDHSEDESLQVIHSCAQGLPLSVVSCPEGITGKKAAIRHALQSISTEFILSMDADVVFDETYFERIQNLPVRDMHVLPVTMFSESLAGNFAVVDHLLVNALNAAMAGWKRPFICSGANLLYRKAAFVLYDRYYLHKHLPSGDDTYLLRDFYSKKASISVCSDPGLCVQTDVPSSIKKFFRQRVRWVGKTADLNDSSANTMIFLIVFLTALFFAALGFLVFHHRLTDALLLFAVKSVVDIIAFIPFFLRFKKISLLLCIPLYEIVYPFYAVALTLAVYMIRPTWKGREIRVR